MYDHLCIVKHCYTQKLATYSLSWYEELSTVEGGRAPELVKLRVRSLRIIHPKFFYEGRKCFSRSEVHLRHKQRWKITKATPLIAPCIHFAHVTSQWEMQVIIVEITVLAK
jgi:hypothetical protein